jgi:hypothetical protein
MSNLASMIMEGSGGFYGSGRTDLPYDHEDGAAKIAMESAEALRDIFEAEFYIPNSCTIQAALEGYSCVEESSHYSVMEGAIKGAFEKIKQFLIKLKDKVVSFLHNIKRYLLGVFGNDAKWVGKYEKELTSLKSEDLKDYKIKMYEYVDNLESFCDKTVDVDALTKMAEENTKKWREGKVDERWTNPDSEDNLNENDAFKEAMDKQYLKFIRDSFAKPSLDEDDDLTKAAWSAVRNQADDESDMEEVTVGPSQIKTYIEAIKKGESKLTKYDSMISKTNQQYKKAIDFVNKQEKTASTLNYTGTKDWNEETAKQKGAAKAWEVNEKKQSNASQQFATICRIYASYLSKCQSAHNTLNTALKNALVERNKAYKKALTGAFAYARKQRKNK